MTDHMEHLCDLSEAEQRPIPRAHTCPTCGTFWTDDGYGWVIAAEAKPSVQLTGRDGNIFHVLGLARRALLDAGQKDRAAEMRDRVLSCHSYDDALGIITEYVEAY